MSRVSDLRDGIIEELKILQPDDRIMPFWAPNFPAEWLSEGPIIGIRSAQRLINAEQGPDFRRIGIEVGVFGILSPSDATSTDPLENLSAQVQSGDALDQLVEDLIGYWSPGGALDGTDGKGIADHSYQTISMDTVFDAPLLIEFGQWASVFLLTYLDTLDE